MASHQPEDDRFTGALLSRYGFHPPTFTPFEPEEEDERGPLGQFTAGALHGFAKGNPTMLGEALEAFGVAEGSETLIGWGERLRRFGEGIDVGPEPMSREEADGVWEHILAVAGTIGSATGSTVLPIAGGVAGAAAGAPFGQISVPIPIVGAVGGATVGAYLGATSLGYPLNLGEVYGQLKAEGLDREEAAKWAFRINPYITAMDMFSLGRIGTKILGGTARKSAIRFVARQIMEGSITEGFTEGLQASLREGTAAALTGNRDLQRRALAVMDEAIGGAGAGGLFGGAGATGQALRRRRGVMEQAEGGVAPLSEADQASPIPDNLIQRGREIIAGLESKKASDASLSEFGVPGIGEEAVYRSGELESTVRVVDFVPADESAPAQLVVEDENGVTTDLQLPLEHESLEVVPTGEDKGGAADLTRFGEEVQETVRGREEFLAEELIREDVENLTALPADRRSNFLSALKKRIQQQDQTTQEEQRQQDQRTQEEQKSEQEREREADEGVLFERERTEALEQAEGVLTREQVAAAETGALETLGAELETLSPGRRKTYLKILNINLKAAARIAQAEGKAIAPTPPGEAITPTAETQPPTAPIPYQAIEVTKTLTSAGKSHPVEYAVVEADSLTPSHDKLGNETPNYPQFLQPRDRARKTSQLQIQEFSKKLNPELLDRSAKAADGSPIVDPAGVVESGNARTLAIQTAYEEGNADEYRAYLKSKGYPVEGISKPVLVRIRRDNLSDAERAEFAREANVSSIGRMSRTEQAFADAESLNARILNQYEGRKVRSRRNEPFVRSFIQGVVGETDRATFADTKGKLTAEGSQRVEAALIAKAYGDRALVEKLAESADPGRITLRNALVAVAPRWAAMRERVKAETLHKGSVDQTAALTTALKLMERSQESRTPIANLLSQKALFSEMAKSQKEITRGFLSLFHKDPEFTALKTAREIEGAFEQYLGAVSRYDPRQKTLQGKSETPDILSMLGVKEEVTVPSRDETVTAAIAQLQNLLKEGEPTALNPKIMAAGATLANFHREAGVKTYADMEKAILSDLGQKAKPFIRTWYNLVETPSGERVSARPDKPKIPVPPSPKPSPPPTAPTPIKGKQWGEDNTIVTLDRSKELDKIIRDSLSKLKAGLDPELLAAGLEISVFHFEAGARKFSDYSARMIDSFGEKVRPYLKRWYRGIRSWPGLDTKGMSTDAEIEALAEEPTITKPTPPKAPKKKAKEPAVKRLQDAGEKLEGKRKRKAAELQEGRDKEAADEADRILDLTSKAGIWPIILPEGATPGTQLFLSQVRTRIAPFHKAASKIYRIRSLFPWHFAGKSKEGTKSKFKSAIVSKEVDLDKLREEAATYIALVETIKEATDGSTNVGEASRALINLFSTEETTSAFGKMAWTYMEFGSWQTPHKVFAAMASRIADNETVSIKKTKPMRRPTYKFDPSQGPGREGLPDHRKGENKSGDDLVKEFGFRGVEFGNWVTGIERQRHVNWAYDALMDLASIMNAKPKDLSLGGALGIAFGSRGRGRHSAHYEPSTHVINITKTRGDGSLAHEWSHALDYHFRDQSKKFSGTDKGRAAYRVHNETKRSLASTISLELVLRRLDDLVSGRSWIHGQKALGPIANAQAFIDNRYWQKNNWGAIRRTSYGSQAAKIGKYWVRNEELWARSFEAWTLDTLGQSQYLVNSWAQEGQVTKAKGYKGQPYPESEERASFNQMWGDIIQAIKWTDNGPEIEVSYVSEWSKQLGRIEAELNAIDLEARRKEVISGLPSKDGLWWYRIYTKRGPGNQPDGYRAFDEKQPAGSTMLGYGQGLDPEVAKSFRVTPVRFESTESTVYLKGGEDVAVLGDQSEEALDRIQAEVREISEGERRAERGTQEGRGKRRTDVRVTGEEGGEPLGGAARGEDILPTPSRRGGRSAAGTRSGSLRATDYRITDSDRSPGGSAGKFGANLAAIETLQKIQKENRLATPEEQAILVQYSGWGGLKSAFDSWTAMGQTLRKLLTDEEFAQAKSSMLNAHYTSFPVIRAMWSAVKRLGFEQGRILEPAAGVGHFLGLIPDSLREGSNFTAVEIDSVSAAITGQLYQKAAIHHKAFQDTSLPANFFDLVITNVPFLEVAPFDPVYNPKRSMLLHDYYLKKSIALTRPGGVVAAITSKGTMDKRSDRARKAIAEDADLIAAIRMPEDAFLKNAGTTVTTDILFFRRKVEGETFKEAADWIETSQQGLPQKDNPDVGLTDFPINTYYVKNPDMMLGRMVARRGRYGQDIQSALIANSPQSLPHLLGRTIEEFPQAVIPDIVTLPEITPADSIPNEGEVLDGGFTTKEATLYQRQGDNLILVPEKTQKQRSDGVKIRKFIRLRGVFKKLMRLQVEQVDPNSIASVRTQLGSLYDSYVKQHGFLNATLDRTPFRLDPNAPSLLALENWDQDTKTATKAGIFTRNTISPRTIPKSADNPEDALAISLNEEGRVNLELIASLTNATSETASESLRGKIIDDPERGWVPMDEYLSGNVREKLRIAQSASKTDPKYQENIEALKSIQPIDLTAVDVVASAGSPWIPANDVALFMSQLIGFPVTDIEVEYVDAVGEWSVQPRTAYSLSSAKTSVAARNEWGTTRKSFFDLMPMALNGGFPKVYDTDPSTNKRYINRVETEAAQDKLRNIKRRFQEWAWEDGKRAKRLLGIYNDRMNSIRLRTFDGSHLSFPMMTTEIELTEHQKNSVWRILQSGGTYLGHEVGTGKSFILITAAMKARQMGLSKKPLLAVPKPLLEQFTHDFFFLYPNAKILTVHIPPGSTPKSRLAKRRAVAQIANNDWDAVIVSHGSFDAIGVSREEMHALRKEQGGDLAAAIEALAAEEGQSRSRLRRTLEVRLVKLNEKLKELESKVKREKFITFEETGVDLVLIDEAHEYKNLTFSTRYGRSIRGLTPTGSGKATELYAKTKYLHRNSGKMVLASGTPLTNSIGELFTISRYLQPDALENRNIKYFDRWASIFGAADEVMEYKPEGGGFRPVMKLDFQNMPELLQMVYSVLDVVTADKVGIKRPKIKGSKPIPVVLEQSEDQLEFQQSLERRAKAVRIDPVGELPDNMLAVVMDGRKAAIDMRFIGPQYELHPQGKIAEVGRKAKDVYDRTNQFKGTQLIFLDLTKTRGAGWSFNAQNAVRESLLREGIPESEIAIYHEIEGPSRVAKARMAKLFKAVNQGDVRVLIASTSKGGTGLNVQERGAAIHHLDINWTVAKYLQRTGRFFRQGNRSHIDYGHELEIYNYATEASVEVLMWDKVAYKERLFQRILSGDMSYRSAEDISVKEVTAAEMVAVTSGDPLIMEREELFQRVSRLRDLKQAWIAQQYDLKRRAAFLPRSVRAFQSDLDLYRNNLNLLGAVETIQFDRVNPKTGDISSYSFPLVTKDKKKSKALLREWTAHLDGVLAATGGNEQTVGNFRGEAGDVSIAMEFYYRAYKKGWDIKDLSLVLSSFRSRHDAGAHPRSLVKTALGRVEKSIDRIEKEIDTIETRTMPDVQEALDKPFELRDELSQKSKRLDEIDQHFKEQDRGEEDEASIDKEVQDLTSQITEDMPAKKVEQIKEEIRQLNERRPSARDRAIRTVTTTDQVNEEAERESSGRPPRTSGAAALPPPGPPGVPPSRRREGPPSVPPAPPSGPEFTFTPEAERRYQEGLKGEKGEPLAILTRIHEWMADKAQGFVREYATLPETPQFANAKAKLRILKAATSVTSADVFTHIRELVGGLNKKTLTLLTRKIVMDDLYEDVRRGLEIPIFLEGIPDFIANYRALNREMKKHPDLMRRVRARRAFNNKIKLRLYNKGLIDKESLSRKNYFTHKVLEFAHDSIMAYQHGRAPGVKRPKYHPRRGTQLLINTNLIEAESQYLSKALMGLAEVELIEWIDQSNLNLREELKGEIRASNFAGTSSAAISEAQQLLKEKGLSSRLASPLSKAKSLFDMRKFIEDHIELVKDTAFPIFDQMETFRKTIGRGFGQLKDTLTPEDVPDRFKPDYERLIGAEKDSYLKGEFADSVFPLVTWVMKNIKGEPSMAAATIMSAISTRRSFMKSLLGKRFLNANNMEEAVKQFRRRAPESKWADVSAWQPKKGKMFFTAMTLSQRVMDGMVENIGQILNETDGLVGFFPASEVQDMLDTMRPQLVLGGPNYELVIPTELAATLESLGQDDFNNVVLKEVEKLTRMWKIWVLINPLSWFKYFTQNLSGDFDFVLGTMPKALRPSKKLLTRSVSEIWDVMVKKGTPSAAYRRGAEQGVFDAGWSTAEVYTIQDHFEDLLSDRSIFGMKGLRKLWNIASRSQTMRENWLRYALFLHFEQSIKEVRASPGGEQKLARDFMPLIGYAAGRPEIADAISDDTDRAGYLARETIGDYQAISQHGNLARRTLYPFWSFQEINLRRYYRVGKNILWDTANPWTKRNQQLVKLGARVGLRSALWMTMTVFLWKTSVFLWNTLWGRDLEKELRDEQRRRGNIILGKVGNSVISLRAPGALDDLMAWFGFDDVRAALEHVEKGRGTFGDVVKAFASAPLNKFVNGLHPVMKVPFETALGVRFFPTFTNPRIAADPWRTWPQTVKLEAVYDHLLGRPSLGLGQQFAKVFFDVQDPESGAYYKIRGEAYQWKRTVKGGIGGPRYMGERAIAYHYYRQALKFKDAKAVRFWRRRLRKDLRVTASQEKAMLHRAHPIGMLSKRDRLDFRRTLTPAERRSYQRAVRYWRERYLRP